MLLQLKEGQSGPNAVFLFNGGNGCNGVLFKEAAGTRRMLWAGGSGGGGSSSSSAVRHLLLLTSLRSLLLTASHMTAVRGKG